MRRPLAVVTANRGFALTRSRWPLLRALRSRGWRVIVACPTDSEVTRLGEDGFEHKHLPFRRGGLSPVHDGSAIWRLRLILKELQPDLVHSFNAKPIIFASVARRTAGGGAILVHTVTGIGKSLSGPGWRSRLVASGYRLAGRTAAATVFQNPEDRTLFVSRGWVSSSRARLIPGSGVDTTRFRPREGAREGSRTVLMVTRLIAPKGVAEFIGAANRVRRRRDDIRFLLAGEWDPGHPDAVPRSVVEEAVAAGHIEFLGYLDHPEDVLPGCDLFVFPSYYREGVPRVLLEALACGTPVIAADVAGSRDTVRHGETGWLVQPRSEQQLEETILAAFGDSQRLAMMRQEARMTACREFDIETVTQRHLEMYDELGLPV